MLAGAWIGSELSQNEKSEHSLQAAWNSGKPSDAPSPHPKHLAVWVPAFRMAWIDRIHPCCNRFMSNKKVMVAGCFDLLHPSQVKFLLKAASFGDLYVSLGRDQSIVQQKNKSPVCDEQERKFMLENLKCVHWVGIVTDPSPVGFAEHLEKIRPDIFVINEDGDYPEKREICSKYKVEYKVFPRDHFHPDRPTSSTDIASNNFVPTRVSLCSGFMDNPAVNGRVSSRTGSLVVIPIEPFQGLQERSGMATSTIQTVHRFFGCRLPTKYSAEQLAEMIFRLENPPNRRNYISGSLDSRGIVGRGIQLFTYARQTFQPAEIHEMMNEPTLRWVENHVYLKHAWKRPDKCIVKVRDDHPQFEKFCDQMNQASLDCWDAIGRHDLDRLADAVSRSHHAQASVVENHCPAELGEFIEREKAGGAMIMGAGGGGYVAFIADALPADAIQIRIKRAEL